MKSKGLLSSDKYELQKQSFTIRKLLPWFIAIVSLTALALILIFGSSSIRNWSIGWLIGLVVFLLLGLGGLIYLAFDRVSLAIDERKHLFSLLGEVEDAKSRAYRWLEAVFQINQKFVDANNEQEIIDLVLQSAVDLAGIKTGLYIPLDEHGQPLAAVAFGKGPHPIPDAIAEYLASPHVRDRCRACEKGFPMDTTCPLLTGPFNDAKGLYCLPLRRAEREYGVLNLYLPDKEELDSETQAFLRSLADQTALALEGLRLRQREIATIQQLQAVREKTDLSVQLKGLLENLRQTLEVDFALLSLREVSSFTVDNGKKNEEFSSGECSTQVYSLIEGILQGVWKSREPVILKDIVGETNSVTKGRRQADVRSIMATPLGQEHGKQGGVLLVGSKRAQMFSSRQLSVLQNVASQIAFVLNTTEYMAELQYQAMIEERTRLAREIHDGIAQTLGFLKLHMSQMQSYLERNELETLKMMMRTSYGTMSDAYQDIRYAIDGLRISLEGEGNPWLKQIIQEFQETMEMEKFHVELVNNDVPSFVPPEVQAQFLRILQEALSNIRKHSQATNAWVSYCQENGDVVLEIRDNGIGFASEDVPGPSQHGLRGMRERAELIGADFQIISLPNQGTVIKIRLPINQGEYAK